MAEKGEVMTFHQPLLLRGVGTCCEILFLLWVAKEVDLATLSSCSSNVVQIDSPVGYKGRAILNPSAQKVLDGNPPRPTTCDACLKHCSRSFCIIRALTRAQQGDVETGLVFTGANMWKIKEILPVKEIFRRLKEDIEKI